MSGFCKNIHIAYVAVCLFCLLPLSGDGALYFEDDNSTSIMYDCSLSGNNFQISCNTGRVLSHEVVPNYTYDSHVCGPVGTYCCCDDGNSRVCWLMGLYFSCVLGGYQQCYLDLGDCDATHNCDGCCVSCA